MVRREPPRRSRTLRLALPMVNPICRESGACGISHATTSNPILRRTACRRASVSSWIRRTDASPTSRGRSRARKRTSRTAESRFRTTRSQNADPLARCYIPGVPRITYLGWPFEIVQSKDFVGIVYEWMHIRRMIPLTNRPVPEGIDFWGGLSRGRWDGNSLVVKVTNLSDWTWFDMAGNFHSNAAQIEERYTRIGPDTIDYEVTIADPDVFARPWKMRMPIQRQPDARLLEYECHELLEQSGVPLTWERDWDKPMVIPKE